MGQVCISICSLHFQFVIVIRLTHQHPSRTGNQQSLLVPGIKVDFIGVRDTPAFAEASASGFRWGIRRRTRVSSPRRLVHDRSPVKNPLCPAADKKRNPPSCPADKKRSRYTHPTPGRSAGNIPVAAYEDAPETAGQELLHHIGDIRQLRQIVRHREFLFFPREHGKLCRQCVLLISLIPCPQLGQNIGIWMCGVLEGGRR